jgi:hypothetical protein
MKTLMIGGLAAFLALQVGCSRADPPAPPPVAAAPTPAAPAEATSAAVAADVPTQQDYDTKAEKTIATPATPGVLTQELDALEKEIGP